MTRYVVMFPADNEDERAAGTEADRQATFDIDFEFGQLLEARGGAVTGGAGLTHASEARTIKRGPKSTALVTDGPYAETVEQLTGFYVVRSDDLDDLLDLCRILADGDGAVEVRACVPPQQGGV